MNQIPQLVQVKRRIETEFGTGCGLELKWKDGREDFLSSEVLRGRCPCASCQEARGDSSHAAPLSPKPETKKSSALRVIKATVEESRNLVQIRPVGNYAINLLWGDKHDSGIFSYQFLRELIEAN